MAVDAQKRPAGPLHFEVAPPVFFVNIEKNIVRCIEKHSKKLLHFCRALTQEKTRSFQTGSWWLRGQDLNLRPPGYEKSTIYRYLCYFVPFGRQSSHNTRSILCKSYYIVPLCVNRYFPFWGQFWGQILQFYNFNPNVPPTVFPYPHVTTLYWMILVNHMHSPFQPSKSEITYVTLP